MSMADISPSTGAMSPSRRTPRGQGSRSPLQEKRGKSQTRTPLQEKSSSETNVGASTRTRDVNIDNNVFTSTPFPTKPQHILLPSTVRKQKSFHNSDTNLFARSQHDAARQNISSRDTGVDGIRPHRAPVLQLKKSVTTLRDMYEAQEKSSRPSTATSPALRPTTSSSRLRSASSSDGLAGRYAWENFGKITSDDMALLPSLNETIIRKMDSEQSFASRMTRTAPLTSSPNFRVYATSSPKVSVYRDESDFSSDPTQSINFDREETTSSSPNFVRLGRSSSYEDTATTLPSSSSPNFVRLGTSSPGQLGRKSPTPSTDSAKSLKRKRENAVEDSIAHPHRGRPFDSSPPYIAPAASSSEPSLQSPDSGPLASSPPDLYSARPHSSSSPVFRLPTVMDRNRSSSSSSSSAHASLQAALSSSPMPPIQYPVVRAPTSTAQVLTVPKRYRGSQTDHAPFSTRLSPVPSEWDEASRNSDLIEELEEELTGPSKSVQHIAANDSQIRIIADDDHEATDELSALPRGVSYRSPPLIPARINSLYGTSSSSSTSQSQSRLNSLRHSMDSRLNSMKSYTHSRRDSLLSNSLRPTSSGSVTTNVIVPTWARRYYSGFYRDSFQYLYPPSQNNSFVQLPLPSQPRPTLHPTHSHSYRTASMQASTRTSRSSRRSFQSIRNSLRESIIERMPGRIRPRMEARKSHLTAGVGPLVSNPVEPTLAVVRNESALDSGPSVRMVYGSGALNPVDPRAHWAGVTHQGGEMSHGRTQQYTIQNVGHRHTQSSESGSIYYDSTSTPGMMPGRAHFLPSPHLHHDRRLNTGSSTSRGYGFPFNQRTRYGPPPVDSSFTGFHLDLRRAQKVCFILGFLCPLAWFLASFLPLPARPSEYSDVEKAEWDAATMHGQKPLGENEEMDVVARLRMERHVRGMEEMDWQNARWWRRMNRSMSYLGAVIVILAIVLAVLGTRRNW